MEVDASRLSWIVFILVFFIIVRAFYSACEFALVEVNDNKIKSMADKNKKYQSLLNILNKPHVIMQTFFAHRVISNIIISLLSVVAFGGSIRKLFETYFTHDLSVFLSLLVLILCLGIVLVTFTDALPKRLVSKFVEPFALFCVAPVRFLQCFYFPFNCATYGVSWLFCKILGLPVVPSDDVVTEEEILMMVEAGNETGVIEQSQREMINNIFEFDDIVVSDVMTHRTDVTAIDVESKIGDVVYIAINQGYSRLPVYEKSVDNIIGILNVKDLLCLVGCEHSEDFSIRQFIRKADFIPENAKCKDVLEMMTRNKSQMMIISDEYGGTLGIVTMEDLLEEIVGNIQDEYDDEELEISEIDKGLFTIDGSADPEDICPMLGIELPEGHNYDTMSAFFVDKFGRVPENDENAEFAYENVRFKVLLVEDNWISKLKAQILTSE